MKPRTRTSIPTNSATAPGGGPDISAEPTTTTETASGTAASAKIQRSTLEGKTRTRELVGSIVWRSRGLCPFYPYRNRRDRRRRRRIRPLRLGPSIFKDALSDSPSPEGWANLNHVHKMDCTEADVKPSRALSDDPPGRLNAIPSLADHARDREYDVPHRSRCIPHGERDVSLHVHDVSDRERRVPPRHQDVPPRKCRVTESSGDAKRGERLRSRPSRPPPPRSRPVSSGERGANGRERLAKDKGRNARRGERGTKSGLQAWIGLLQAVTGGGSLTTDSNVRPTRITGDSSASRRRRSPFFSS